MKKQKEKGKEWISDRLFEAFVIGKKPIDNYEDFAMWRKKVLEEKK